MQVSFIASLSHDMHADARSDMSGNLYERLAAGTNQPVPRYFTPGFMSHVELSPESAEKDCGLMLCNVW